MAKRFATLADIREAQAAMWHAANVGFSKTDRAAFNSWRAHLWKLADELRDRAQMLPDEPRYERLCQLSESIMKMVADVPVMEK